MTHQDSADTSTTCWPITPEPLTVPDTMRIMEREIMRHAWVAQREVCPWTWDSGAWGRRRPLSPEEKRRRKKALQAAKEARKRNRR